MIMTQVLQDWENSKIAYGEKQGEIRGEIRGEIKGKIEILYTRLKMTIEEIADDLKISVAEVQRIVNEL